MKHFSSLNNEQIGVHTSKWRTENSDNKWVSQSVFPFILFKLSSIKHTIMVPVLLSQCNVNHWFIYICSSNRQVENCNSFPLPCVSHTRIWWCPPTSRLAHWLWRAHSSSKILCLRYYCNILLLFPFQFCVPEILHVKICFVSVFFFVAITYID